MFVSFLFFSRHPFRIQVSWYSGTYPFTGRISHKISPPICISTCAWKISNPWVSRPRFLAPCASCWFTLFLVRQDHANRWQIQQTRTFHSFRKGETRSTIVFSQSLCNLPCFLDLCCVGFVVVLSYIMMGRTLCARKPPFDCDGAQGSASSQQVSRKFWNLTIWRSDRLREKSSNAEESNWRRGKDGYARLTSI